MTKKACVLIPAYQPNQALLDVVSGLLAGTADKVGDNSFRILIVNDGSTELQALQILGQIKEIYHNEDCVECLDLSHNLGKGGALKAGLRHIYEKQPEIEWIITADADGQHLPSDIRKLIDAGGDSSAPVLGVRSFHKDIPMRSYIGNVITKKLFKLFHSLDVEDTQTGLRGFDRTMIDTLLDIPSNGYDFELDGLICFSKNGALRQLPIKTVYEAGNPSSHFNPLIDSLKIYAVLFRHIIFTGLAMLIEITIFSILSNWSIAIALTISRVIAGTALFFAARNYVFKVFSDIKSQAIKYIMLVFANLSITIILVEGITQYLDIHRVTALFFAYVLMFILNFIIQKYFIFYHSSENQ